MQKMKMPILASVIVITLVATALGMGTFAYFSDVEISDNNLLKMATLQLKVDRDPTSAGTDWVDGNAVPELHTVTGFAEVVNKMYPGQEEEVMVGIKNVGNMAGYPNLEITDVVNLDSPFLLSSLISVEIWYGYDDAGYTETYVGTATLDYWNTNGPIYSTYELAANGEAYWRLNLHISTSAGNNVQGDRVTFDVEFGIHQVQGSK